MPTRNIVITDHQAQLVEQLVISGRYQNASEVLREGLRLVELQEVEYVTKLKALHDAIQLGKDDIAAGRFKTFKSAQSLTEHLNALADKTIGKVLAE
ncbi:MAG: type II toxin-antitoxin system ParD family antitoxin [Alcaligenaceae bacterium]|nr:type II toxin-antitoxin system ParD family antitoxin [Alcaligenaceae bacterium]